jgi:hypothetical protein
VRELFVWYRVAEAHAAEAETAVLSMQRALEAGHRGLVTGLLVRRDEPAGAQTWMETYACADAAGGIDANLEHSIAAHASSLDALIEGPRHVEAFERLRG